MPQVDARLDRRRKGVFGPQQGMRAIVFLDDLSMPLPEQYGAQVCNASTPMYLQPSLTWASVIPIQASLAVCAAYKSASHRQEKHLVHSVTRAHLPEMRLIYKKLALC